MCLTIRWQIVKHIPSHSKGGQVVKHIPQTGIFGGMCLTIQNRSVLLNTLPFMKNANSFPVDLIFWGFVFPYVTIRRSGLHRIKSTPDNK